MTRRDTWFTTESLKAQSKTPKRGQTSNSGGLGLFRVLGDSVVNHVFTPDNHYAASMPLDARKIEQLRQWRNPVAPDLSMTGEFHKFAQDARRQAKQLGGAGDAWLAVCPPDLLARTQLGAMSRGVLTVKTTDAGVKFQVDRWLREQGERLLVERCPTLIRVKVV